MSRISPHQVEAMEAFYAALEQRIASHSPRCINRGLCCKFGEYGHKLFVTPLELMYFDHAHPDARKQITEPAQKLNLSSSLTVLNQPSTDGSRDVCPFHRDGMCTTRAGRPMGCRVFFCESEKEGWQGELTEWGLAALKQMHEEFDTPYRYQEWLAAIS